MKGFYEELLAALGEGDDPGAFTLERGVPAGAGRIDAVLTVADPEQPRKRTRVGLDATGLDSLIDRGAVERFADAAASLGLRRAGMLSGRGAALDAHVLATARGVDLLFARENPKGVKSRPYARIYPVINLQEFEPDPAGTKLTQGQWQRVHARTEEKPAMVKILDGSGVVVATFRDLVRALPLDRPEAFTGKGFSGKRAAKHAYAYPGATLEVKGMPPIAIRGVSFDYWVEVSPIEKKTRGAAFADILVYVIVG